MKSMLIALGSLVCLFGSVACSILTPPTPTPLPTPDLKSMETRIAGNIFATQTASAPTATPKPTATATPQRIGRWDISTSKSSFDDSETVVVSLDADSAIKGWLDTYVPRLILRCQESQTEVYVIVGMSQAVESGARDTATVRIRFDSLAAKTQVADQSTSGKALFFRNPRAFIAEMLPRKKMIFGFTPFNASPVETSFTLDGLTEAVKPLQKACPKN